MKNAELVYDVSNFFQDSHDFSIILYKRGTSDVVKKEEVTEIPKQHIAVAAPIPILKKKAETKVENKEQESKSLGDEACLKGFEINRGEKKTSAAVTTAQENEDVSMKNNDESPPEESKKEEPQTETKEMDTEVKVNTSSFLQKRPPGQV